VLHVKLAYMKYPASIICFWGQPVIFPFHSSSGPCSLPAVIYVSETLSRPDKVPQSGSNKDPLWAWVH